jgi:Cupin-like domain
MTRPDQGPPPTTPLRLPTGLATRYWACHTLRQLLGGGWFQGWRRRLDGHIQAISTAVGDGPVTEIPRVAAADMDPARFHREHLERHRPVVIEGLAQAWPAVKTWTPAWFGEHHGDLVVPVRVDGSRVDDYRYTRTTMARLVEDVLAGGVLTATGLENLFLERTELRDDLELDVLNAYVAPQSGRGAGRHFLPRIFSTELFLGNQRSRTSLHCAFANNLFVMLHGHKTWTMVDPAYTPWVQPDIPRYAHHGRTSLDYNLGPDELAASGYPLFRHAPKLRTVLQPGDALFSPQWWWHAVENDGPTLAISARALTDLFFGQRVMSTLAMMSRPGIEMFVSARHTGWASDRKIRYIATSWE